MNCWINVWRQGEIFANFCCRLHPRHADEISSRWVGIRSDITLAKVKAISMVLILFNCLIDTIYFMAASLVYLHPTRSNCLGYILLLTHSIIPQTFEYILNTHFWELLTWMERDFFRFFPPLQPTCFPQTRCKFKWKRFGIKIPYSFTSRANICS